MLIRYCLYTPENFMYSHQPPFQDLGSTTPDQVYDSVFSKLSSIFLSFPVPTNIYLTHKLKALNCSMFVLQFFFNEF